MHTQMHAYVHYIQPHVHSGKMSGKNSYNMAATRELVASELLCYILNKFGRVAEDKIKSIILDFYTTEEISEGKIMLNKNFVQVKLEELPRLKKRLGDNKNTKDLDDIFEMVNLADEKLMLNDLPSFLAVNLERVPHLRPEDLDLVVLSKKVSAIEDRLKLLSDAGSPLVGRCDKSGSECQSLSHLKSIKRIKYSFNRLQL